MAHTLGPKTSILAQLPRPVSTRVVSHRSLARGYGRSPHSACEAMIPGVLVNASVLVAAVAAWARGSFSARRAACRNQRGWSKCAAVRATSNSGAAVSERAVFPDAILSHFGHPFGSLLKDLSEPLMGFVTEMRSKLSNAMDTDVYGMLAVARLREMHLQAEIFNEESKIKLLRVVLNGVRRSVEDVDDEVLELELERDQALERAKKAEAVLAEHDQTMLQLNKAVRELDAELSVAQLRLGGVASAPHSTAEERPPQSTLLSPGTMDEAALRRECSYWLRSGCVQDLPPLPTEETSLARLRVWVRTARLRGKKAQQLVSGVQSTGSPRQNSRVQLSAAKGSQGPAQEGSGGSKQDLRTHDHAAGNPVGWIFRRLSQPMAHFVGTAACTVRDAPPAHSFAGASLQQPCMARAQTTVSMMEQSSRITDVGFRITDVGFSINDDASLIVLAASWAREVNLQKQLSRCKQSVTTLKATLKATTKYTRDAEEEAIALEMVRDDAVGRALKAETAVFHERLHRSSELKAAKDKLERALTAARARLGPDSTMHMVDPSMPDQCLPSPGSMDEQQLRAEGARLGYGLPPAGKEASLARLRVWVRSGRRRARKA